MSPPLYKGREGGVEIKMKDNLPPPLLGKEGRKNSPKTL